MWILWGKRNHVMFLEFNNKHWDLWGPTCLDFLCSLDSASSDMLLLWARPLLALLCLLSASALLHQHAHHVHHLPRPELCRFLPHAVPHRLRARPGKCELPKHFLIICWQIEFAKEKQCNVIFFRQFFLGWIAVTLNRFVSVTIGQIEGIAAAATVEILLGQCDLKVASTESSGQPSPSVTSYLVLLEVFHSITQSIWHHDSRIHSKSHLQIKFLHIGFLEYLKSANLLWQIRAG